MTTATTNGAAKPSMNEANARDPFNNNSYGTLVDQGYKKVSLPVLDVDDFNERIIRGYEEGWGERDLPADLSVARSLIPAGTATLRDFSNISPEIPEYITENCTGCMDCVTECPDTAILGKVLSETELEEKLKALAPQILPFAGSVWRRLDEMRRAGRRILFEGAQGTMLDVDHGTYPYVTSSNTLAGQAAVGSGLGPGAIGFVLGITKAYTTRVGAGPFPTEQVNAIGQRLGERGHEFGTVTGRKRR